MSKLLKAIELIEKHSKEGDVHNFIGHPKWYAIHEHIAYWGIRGTQKKVFKNATINYNGLKLNCNRYTHTAQKFSKGSIIKHIINDPNVDQRHKDNINKIFKKWNWAKTFSIEPPRATFIPLEDYALDDIAIYRYTKKELTDKDIGIMIKATLPMLGTKYDYGQLMNIAVNTILGYPYDEKVKWFDLGGKRKVCSVGMAVIFQKWRKVLESEGFNVQRLFRNLNKKAWTEKFIKDFKKLNRWDVENTFPAMFALTKTHFDGEFELIIKMNKGRVQYLKR